MGDFKTLFGFTIGPIYEMMSHSRKTKELWFSSYFFSWYVEKFCNKLKLLGTGNIKILTPFIPQKLPTSWAGLFPDHIVGTSGYNEEDTLKTLTEINTEVKRDFVSLIQELGKAHYIDSSSHFVVEHVFNNYIQTGMIVRPAAEIKQENIIETIDVLLDASERNRSFPLGRVQNTCGRCLSLPSAFNPTLALDGEKAKPIKLCPFCYFKLMSNTCKEVKERCIKKEGTNEQKTFRFKSTGDISSVDLINQIGEEKFNEYLKSGSSDKDEIDFDDPAFKKLVKENCGRMVNGKKEDGKIKDYHKYVAIVQADGDGLGNIANQSGNPEKLSKTLYDFGVSASKITEDYLGVPVYIGGDDLLSFMPVGSKMDKEGKEDFISIIDYITALAGEYKKELTELPGVTSASMSFGVQLFYYKAPLSIARDNAYYQLNRVSKREKGKNTAALVLTLHSGQKTGLQFKIGSGAPLAFTDLLIEKDKIMDKFRAADELQAFNILLKGVLSEKILYPEGIHHNLARYKNILTNLSDKKQIKNFQTNRFNEEEHKYFTGIDLVFLLLEKLLIDPSGSGSALLTGKAAETQFDDFLSQLRFIKFLSGDKS